MPPDEKLYDAEIAELEQWISMVAPDPRSHAAKHIGKQIGFAAPRGGGWSLKPITNLPIPKVKNAAWLTSDIDRFILAELDAKNLNPAQIADKRVRFRSVGQARKTHRKYLVHR